MQKVELLLNIDGERIKVCRDPDQQRPCVVSSRLSQLRFSQLHSLANSLMIPYSTLSSALLSKSIELVYESVKECPHQIALSLSTSLEDSPEVPPEDSSKDVGEQN